MTRDEMRAIRREWIQYYLVMILDGFIPEYSISKCVRENEVSEFGHELKVYG